MCSRWFFWRVKLFPVPSKWCTLCYKEFEWTAEYKFVFLNWFYLCYNCIQQMITSNIPTFRVALGHICIHRIRFIPNNKVGLLTFFVLFCIQNKANTIAILNSAYFQQFAASLMDLCRLSWLKFCTSCRVFRKVTCASKTCFFYPPSEVCRSCIFLIFSAFHNYWWLLTLLLVKKSFFRISPCLVMCKRLLKMQNRLPDVVFSHCLRKFSLIWSMRSLNLNITTETRYLLIPQSLEN